MKESTDQIKNDDFNEHLKWHLNNNNSGSDSNQNVFWGL